MAPKRRPVNVVRSGNAGNSSKPAKPAAATVAAAPDLDNPFHPPRPPPLFPAGYKPPVVQLNEKCQKAGWERPTIDARPNPRSDPQTWTGSCTLRKRISKNVYNLEEVRMVPLPPVQVEAESAALAKHWVATYVLFRVSSIS